MGDCLKSFVILMKNSYFNVIWFTFCTFFAPFEGTKFFRFVKPIKKLNCLVFPLLTIHIYSQTFFG